MLIKNDAVLEPELMIEGGPAVGVSVHTGHGPVVVWSDAWRARSAAHCRRSDLWEWENTADAWVPFEDWPLELIAERVQLYADRVLEVRQLLALELPADWRPQILFRLQAIEGVRRQLEAMLRRRLVRPASVDVPQSASSGELPASLAEQLPA